MLPLVLLPGMNCTRDLWTGCGVSDALTPALTETAMPAQVERLLDELPERFLLGGLSLGAIVAMALVARAPERVAGLCVASTNAKAPTDAQRAGWRRWLERLEAGDTPRELQSGIVEVLLSPRALGTASLVERTLAMGDGTGAEQLRAQLLLQGTRTDLREQLRRVAVPTVVVSGREDAICPPAFHREIAREVPYAVLHAVDGGHLLPMERPAAFGGIVRRWRAAVRV